MLMIISNMCILLSFASIASKISLHDPGKKGGWYQFQYLERWWAENSSQGLCRCLAQKMNGWIILEYDEDEYDMVRCVHVMIWISFSHVGPLQRPAKRWSRTCLRQCTKCNHLCSCWGHLEDVARACPSYQPLSLQRFPHWYELVFIYPPRN